MQSNNKLKQLIKESILEGSDLSPEIQNLYKLVEKFVESGGSFINIGKALKENGYKYSFVTEMLPCFIIKLRSGNFGLVNSKYTDDADFVVGNIAGGKL